MRWTRRSGIAAVALVVVGCAPPATAGAPWCDDFDVLSIEAQSVPEATLIPCIDLVPLGWSIGDAYVDQDGSTFTLHSTIGGRDAAHVEFLSSCDTSGMVRIPSDEADAERFEEVTRIEGGFLGRRRYTFEGGCVSIDFAFDVDVSATLANEVSLALRLVPREEINAGIRSVTGGREQLDPVEPDRRD